MSHLTFSVESCRPGGGGGGGLEIDNKECDSVLQLIEFVKKAQLCCL